GAFGVAYYLVPEFYSGLVDFTPTADMTSTRVFLEKIPYFVFIPFTLVMIILCIWKRLSLIPVLGVMSCRYLMTSLGWTNWLRFAVWLLVGLRIYRLYSFKNSHLNVENVRIAGVSLISVVPIVIDTVLLGLLLLPWLRGEGW